MNDKKKPHSKHVEALFWAEIILGEQRIAATMLGLSTQSIDLECPNEHKPAIGSPCDVCIQLVNRKNTDLPVTCSGSIYEHTDNGVLFQIAHVDDQEGLENLKNIILFHAHDPQQAVRDLDS